MNQQQNNMEEQPKDDQDNPEEEPVAYQEDDMLAPQPEETYEQTNSSDDSADKIEALETELSEAKDKMLRAVAEAENTRKRLLREREDVRKYAVADFARDLLDFSDNFARALASIPEEAKNESLVQNVVAGVEAMEKELLKTLEKHGIVKTEPMGEIFDPNFHEAMFEAPGTGQPAGTIVELIEPGYLLHDRLLRPARVGIAKDEGQGAVVKPSSDEPGSQVDTEV